MCTQDCLYMFMAFVEGIVCGVRIVCGERIVCGWNCVYGEDYVGKRLCVCVERIGWKDCVCGEQCLRRGLCICMWMGLRVYVHGSVCAGDIS